jgi:hypothetical protein
MIRVISQFPQWGMHTTPPRCLKVWLGLILDVNVSMIGGIPLNEKQHAVTVCGTIVYTLVLANSEVIASHSKPCTHPDKAMGDSLDSIYHARTMQWMHFNTFSVSRVRHLNKAHMLCRLSGLDCCHDCIPTVK